MNTPTLHVFENTNLVVEALTEWLAARTKAYIQERELSYWAISGGSTPIALYQRLVKDPTAIPWDSINLFLVDERDVFAKDPQSNYGMIDKILLSHLMPPPARVFRWQTQTEPREALAHYRRELTRLPREGLYPQLDIALLGMGSDGHTASIFPSSPQEAATDWVTYGPGPNAWRYTLTIPLLTHAREVAFLATGKTKSARVRECLQDSDSLLPAAKVSRLGLSVHWFLDSESASEL